jgi:hypothetical protein
MSQLKARQRIRTVYAILFLSVNECDWLWMEVKTHYWMKKKNKEADWRAGRKLSTEIALGTYTIAPSIFIPKFNLLFATYAF